MTTRLSDLSDQSRPGDAARKQNKEDTMENKKNRYVIEKNIYEKHIDDEVHLYGLLHQLAAQAERIRTRKMYSTFWTP